MSNVSIRSFFATKKDLEKAILREMSEQNDKEKEAERIAESLFSFGNLRSLYGIYGKGGGNEVFKLVKFGNIEGFISTNLWCDEASLKSKLPEEYFLGERVVRCEGSNGSVMLMPDTRQSKYGFVNFKTNYSVLEREILGELVQSAMCYLVMTINGSVRLVVEEIFLLPFDVDDEKYESLNIGCKRNLPVYVIKNDKIVGCWCSGKFYRSESKELACFDLSIIAVLPTLDSIAYYLVKEAAG